MAWATLSGCSPSRQDEPLLVAQQALVPQLSPPFDIEAYPALSASLTANGILACGSQRCLGVYSGPAGFPLATRITADGSPVDLPRIHLAANPFAPIAIGVLGDEFLIQSTSDANPDQSTNERYHYDRVRGSDGVLLPDVTALLPAEHVIRIASTANSWALITRTSLTMHQLRVFDSNFQPLGAPVSLPNFRDGALLAADDQYFAVDHSEGTRVSATTGLALDTTPIVLSKYDSGRPTRGAYLNGVYYVVEGGGGIAVTRVSKTGTVLDPDDDFNQIPGGRAAYTGLPSANDNIDVDLVGGKLIVSFQSTSLQLYAITLDPATGLRTGATASAGPGGFAVIASKKFSIDPIGTGALLSNDGNLFAPTSLYPGNTAQSLNSVGAEKALNVASASRTEPMIASNGAGYLAVFRVTDGGDNPIRKIYATRIDSNSGAYLDNPPLYLGMGKTPSVASNGTDYLVMWSTQAGHNQRLVRANGSLGPEKQYAILTSWESQRPIGLTFNGVYFAASGNGGLFTRIDPDGTFIDNPLKSGQGGGGEVVLADTTPTTDRRTFMVLQEAGVGALIDVGNFLVRSQTGSVISPTSMLLSGYNQPFGASDGTNFFVIARFGEGYNVKGLLVDPLTGAQLVGSSTLNLTLDTHEELRGASYDGKSFNVFSIAFPDNQEPRLLMRRFGPTLTPVADEPANGMLINDQAMRLDLGTTYAGFASDGNGCTLVAYTVLDVDRFGNSIKARFINDGATGPCGQGVVPGGTAGSGSGSGGRGSGGGASGGGSGSSNGAGAGGAHALGGNSGTSAGASGVGEGAAGSGKSGASHGGADSGGAQGADDAGAAGVGFGVAGTSELDAGASNAGGSRSDNGGGCGCRVTGTPAAHSWAILALGVGLLRRRRERRAAQCNAS